MIPITTKGRAVLNLFNTPELRAKASEKARNHGLLAGLTADSLALAELLKASEGIDTDTLQEFYAQGLIGFYDYASTHYHVGENNISMLDKFLNGDRIYWKSYS
ncbi:hypothetical protein Si021_01310 [Streptococcus infantarius subsp. infantarius]|nr:Hypothetical protein Sinf_0261 [Streptococcus infantarius subsp. infantarius CJ18]MCO4646536.1 hypothetical protein [Streptococcus infantarius subsp. infantarius]MCO4648567.1 hypothetical protein [Streptococcus infantarius subsp. infantarius]MCO4650568.1 hypothetical protein [Streptococcus infantarius subsp. infantarius]MCO4654401.1 hypothetical protein [Streptococcus infantarius subsp. infantarius]